MATDHEIDAAIAAALADVRRRRAQETPRHPPRLIAPPRHAPRLISPLIGGGEHAVALVMAAAAGFAAVIWIEDIIQQTSASAMLTAALLGGICALAYYGHRIIEGTEVFRWPAAITRTAVGGVFGVVGSEIAGAAGMNDSARTAAAMIIGGTGPKYIDRIMDRAIGDKR